MQITENALIELLDIYEFDLEADEEGLFVYDRQGVNLGGINSDRFLNYRDVVDRMNIYHNDYFVEDLVDLLDEKLDNYDFNDWEDLLKLSKKHLYEEHKYEVDMFDMIVNGVD